MEIKKIAPYLGILVVGLGLVSFLSYKHTVDLEQIKGAYIDDKEKETDAIANRVEGSFKSFYQGLRTMTLLPGVREIDRYGENFEENSKKVMQQIYNNTYVNVTLSEVYLLPRSLDPEKIDQKTNKPEEPILTFDEFITGAPAEKAVNGGETPPELEEVEIYEYRLMKTQLEYLAAKYPTQSSFKGLEVPAITGKPVVACDNSEFTKKDLESGNDKPRTGVVYTLPVYGNDGQFKGAVSGIVRLKVIESLVPKGSHGVLNQQNDYMGVVDPSREFQAASENFKRGLPDQELIYSSVRKLNIVDSTPWELWTALPNAEFEGLSSVRQTDIIFYSGIAVSLLLTFGLCFGVRSSQRYQASLEAKVREKTQELSGRNAAMGLILDNAQEGFLTCNLDGKIGSEYSKIVESWFGIPAKSNGIAQYLYGDDKKRRSFFECGWQQLTDDFMPFEVSAGQLPSMIKRGNAYFSQSYTAIFGGDSKLESVLIVLSDVTAKIEAEQKDREQREILAVFQALSQDRAGFLEFFAESESAIRNLEHLNLSKDIQFRVIHTLKGNSGQYGLGAVADICHELESQLQDGSDSLASYSISLLTDTWNDTSNRLLLLMGDRNRKRIELEEAEYLEVLEKVKEGASHVDIAASIERWRLEPVSKRLDRMAENARRLAERLGYAGFEVQISDNGIRLDPEAFGDFWSSMIHVVRNAVDHGFENTTVVKPTINLKATISGDALVVEVQDNGRGIDWEKIRQKAMKNGVPHGTQAELEACIFADGFTTKDSVTTLSGRGVGMAAVLNSVIRYNGKIEIKSAINRGTTFLFTLPLEQQSNRGKIAA
jgi:signal transduction histidine kinase